MRSIKVPSKRKVDEARKIKENQARVKEVLGEHTTDLIKRETVRTQELQLVLADCRDKLLEYKIGQEMNSNEVISRQLKRIADKLDNTSTSDDEFIALVKDYKEISEVFKTRLDEKLPSSPSAGGSNPANLAVVVNFGQSQ